MPRPTKGRVRTLKHLYEVGGVRLDHLPPALGRIVAQLECDGLVHYTPDQRYPRARLTPAGKQAAKILLRGGNRDKHPRRPSRT